MCSRLHKNGRFKHWTNDETLFRKHDLFHTVLYYFGRSEFFEYTNKNVIMLDTSLTFRGNDDVFETESGTGILTLYKTGDLL